MRNRRPPRDSGVEVSSHQPSCKPGIHRHEEQTPAAGLVGLVRRAARSRPPPLGRLLVCRPPDRQCCHRARDDADHCRRALRLFRRKSRRLSAADRFRLPARRLCRRRHRHRRAPVRRARRHQGDSAALLAGLRRSHARQPLRGQRARLRPRPHHRLVRGDDHRRSGPRRPQRAPAPPSTASTSPAPATDRWSRSGR